MFLAILITNRDYFEDTNIPEYDAMPIGKPPSDISLKSNRLKLRANRAFNAKLNIIKSTFSSRGICVSCNSHNKQ